MRILLVDDDQFFQKFYAKKLTESGFTVDTASDGEEALAKIKAAKPELLLLDLIMPKKDGFEVLQILTTDGTLQTLPVLVFSTLGQEKDKEKAIKLGAKTFVNKSYFDFDGLLKKINEVTDKV